MTQLLFLFLLIQTTDSAKPTTLRGSGLEVTIDLAGWKQEEGVVLLHGHYVRLGMFTAPKARDMSILVDDIPKGATDLNSLCLGSEQSYGGSKAGVKVLDAATLAGKPACFFTFPTELNRRNFYVEMIVDGRWLEIHYSAPDGRDAAALARQSLESVVSSMVAKSIPSDDRQLPVADVTEGEVLLAENRQGCGGKSKDFVCRALAAFKTGQRPSGRPTPVGVAGVSMAIVFGLADDFLQVPPASYIVVSDKGVRTGSFGKPKNKDEERAAQELARAVKAGQHPPDNNVLVIAARADTNVTPAELAERSLVLPNRRGFLRETRMGLVFFALVPQGTGMLLGVYPTP
jgi:hypothetical protein